MTYIEAEGWNIDIEEEEEKKQVPMWSGARRGPLCVPSHRVLMWCNVTVFGDWATGNRCNWYVKPAVGIVVSRSVTKHFSLAAQQLRKGRALFPFLILFGSSLRMLRWCTVACLSVSYLSTSQPVSFNIYFFKFYVLYFAATAAATWCVITRLCSLCGGSEQLSALNSKRLCAYVCVSLCPFFSLVLCSSFSAALDFPSYSQLLAIRLGSSFASWSVVENRHHCHQLICSRLASRYKCTRFFHCVFRLWYRSWSGSDTASVAATAGRLPFYWKETFDGNVRWVDEIQADRQADKWYEMQREWTSSSGKNETWQEK